MALVEVIGDSSSPTVDGGDVVVVDLRETRFDDGIYVHAGVDLAVKRLASAGQHADDAATTPESYAVKPDEVNLMGRALWVGGRQVVALFGQLLCVARANRSTLA
jgi:phage repressor protein C with HTH and peptisase S24 domain